MFCGHFMSWGKEQHACEKTLLAFFMSCKNSPGNTGMPASDISRSTQTFALPFDTISTSVKRLKLRTEVLSKLPVWSKMALQDCSTTSLLLPPWCRRLAGWVVGGQDNTNKQQQLIPSCHSSRACHEDTKLTRWRRGGWRERSKVTGFKGKYGSRGDLHSRLTWTWWFYSSTN